jgi:sec-independent protein translocase protein TatB
MLDVGFSELVMVFLVALLVFGPERLPKLAYQLGTWFKHLRGFVQNARDELERELQIAELRRQLQESQEQLRIQPHWQPTPPEAQAKPPATQPPAAAVDETGEKKIP